MNHEHLFLFFSGQLYSEEVGEDEKNGKIEMYGNKIDSKDL